MTRSLPALAIALAVLAAAAPARAQSFTRVLDPAIEAAPDLASAASWIDADGDGDLDLFVTTWSADTPNLLFWNDGAGHFTRAAIPALDASVAEAFGSSWADADGDGRPDLFVSQLFSGGGALFRNVAGPSLAPVAGPLTDPSVKGNACWADIDLDGDVDLVIACLQGTGGITTPNRLFVNQGGFAFTERDTGALVTTAGTHHTATWADYDDDGDPDLFFAQGGVGTSKRDRLWQNMFRETGVAWFRAITTSPLATDFRDSQLISWADVDDDGDLDAYVLDYTSFPNLLYRNDGGGAFTKLAGIGPIVTDLGSAHGCAWGDFDNDGDLDVYVARDNGQTNRYYRNNHDGTFTSITTGDFVTRTSSNWNAVAGDMDRDGDLDLFVPVRSPASAGLLYRNDLAPGNHWLELRLTGVASNRSALGARVRLRCTIGGAPRWQTREIATGTSYGGQNMLDVHFGLAGATVADSIEIRWPSGVRQTLTAVPADQVLEVIEDVATAASASTISARLDGGVATLAWQVAGQGGAPVTIERATEAGVWSARADRIADAGGRVEFSEPFPPGTARAGWRLAWAEDGARRTAAEVWLAAGAVAFALRAPAASAGGWNALLSLPRAAEVTWRLIDVAGRATGDRHRTTLASGDHTLELDPANRLPAGLYWLEVTAFGETLRVKAPRLR